jgi:hypothetical protein
MPERNTSNDRPPVETVSKTALVTMIVVLVVMSLVALHLNWVHWRRDQIEKVIVTPIATPAPSP